MNENPRTRYAAVVRRACQQEDLALVRALFAQASAEVFTLRGLLPRQDEVVLGRLLTPEVGRDDPCRREVGRADRSFPGPGPARGRSGRRPGVSR